MMGALIVVGVVSGCSWFSPKVSSVFKPAQDFSRTYTEVSPEEEHVLGRAVAARILASFRPVQDTALTQYLTQVGAVLAARSGRPSLFAGYTFVVLDTDQVNAFATPSGYIFVTRGFLSLLRDEDEVAALLAHEISHVVLRHGLQAIRSEHYGSYVQVGTTAVSALDCSGIAQQLTAAFSGAVGDIFDTLLTTGYSREQEYEADQAAAALLARAGYASSALTSVLNHLVRLKEQGGAASGGGWFATHPAPHERLVSLTPHLSESSSALSGKAKRDRRFWKRLKR
jgi:predicted Zn-dependent protease